MVKKCKVIMSNDLVTVIDYDGVLVQLPSIEKAEKYISVEYSNERYNAVADKAEQNDSLTEETKEIKQKKRANKKTTAEKTAEENFDELTDEQV